MSKKEDQEISILGRLLCLEAFLCLMGTVSLISGIITGEMMQLFWGAIIIPGSIILHFVKKKDWKAHWEEEERLRQANLERRLRKEENDARKG